MKTREEIENYLGIKIESYKEYQTRDSGYSMSNDLNRYVSNQQSSYTVIVKRLSEESERALKNLIKDSVQKGDLETAAACHSILKEESTYHRANPNSIGLDVKEMDTLRKYEEHQKAIYEEQEKIKAEQEAKEKAEEQARIKSEQDAKEKEEEQARIKAEQEAKEKAEEQARIKSEQEAKEKEEEQARIKAEQEAKEKEEEQAKIKAEEKINSEEIDYLIENIKNYEHNRSLMRGAVLKQIDADVENKVKTIENKIKELQQNPENPETLKSIEDLNHRIETLEDTLEAYAQCFDGFYISASESLEKFELFKKFQNGEEVPEFYGKHHRERLEREKTERIQAEKQEKDMLEQEYGLSGIEDSEALQRRLEDIVSKGIFLSADKNSEQKIAEFEKMKKVIPRFEEFKNVYLGLRTSGIEDKLYANMDFKNVNYDDLLERATMILEKKTREEAQMKEAEQSTIIEDQSETEISQEQISEEILDDELIVETQEIENTEIQDNIDGTAIVDTHLEDIYINETEQSSPSVDEYWEESRPQQVNTYEQQSENVSTYEVGYELQRTEQQTQKQQRPPVSLWMNRFNNWYSAIDRVSQSAKDKFIKMKSDIINAINVKLKERNSHTQVNTQKQDTYER